MLIDLENENRRLHNEIDKLKSTIIKLQCEQIAQSREHIRLMIMSDKTISTQKAVIKKLETLVAARFEDMDIEDLIKICARCKISVRAPKSEAV